MCIAIPCGAGGRKGPRLGRRPQAHPARRLRRPPSVLSTGALGTALLALGTAFGSAALGLAGAGLLLGCCTLLALRELAPASSDA